MVYSKIKRILLILLCVVVLIFPFWCVAGLCAEIEDLTPVDVSGIDISTNSNYFINQSGGGVLYVPIEVGYIYHINVLDVPSARRVAVSEDIPALNVPYDLLGTIDPNSSYSYIPSSNGYFLCVAPHNQQKILFTREKIDSMNGAVGDLVDNVGPSAIWNIFDTGINYIYIVVIVAFGIFIITLVIKKITKGKEGF